ncbi:MAG: ATP-binding domain-containing protein, partial [Myxococcales bacterium]|nr:ATP-binding domain-containing protein [Myxococcales bacterium]
GWRGADVAQILRFPDRHPGCELIRLEQNYRSTGHILGCADAVIRRNSGRLGKTLWSELGDGEPVRALAVRDEREEARWIANEIVSHAQRGGDLEDIAVFYRTHAQSRALEEGLRLAGLPYNVFGGLRFFDRKEIKDLVAYLRLLITPASDVDLLRVINTPARGIGNTTIARLTEFASRHGLSIWEALARTDEVGLGTAAARRVTAFRALLEGLQEELEHGDLGELAAATLERTGYREALARDDTDETQARLENLQEFVGELDEFSTEQPGATLADYLEQVSLATSVDAGAWSPRAVTLMTVHSAKGLEFNHVYMTGMEERVFPHARSLDDEDPARMEEERRLAYVAITRAKRRLSLSWARQRRLFGQVQVSKPSRFLVELPAQHTLRPHARRPAPPPREPVAPAEPSWNSDIVYDPGHTPARSGASDIVFDAGEPASAASSEGAQLYVGMPIQHRKFGRGEIVGWKGLGADLKLVLRFPGVGVKTVLARFCEPA